MTGMNEKKYCVVSQINLHKSKTCNDDAALFFKYLSRHFYLDEFDRPKGLEPFATSFKYKLSMEYGPDYGIVLRPVLCPKFNMSIEFTPSSPQLFTKKDGGST